MHLKSDYSQKVCLNLSSVWKAPQTYYLQTGQMRLMSTLLQNVQIFSFLIELGHWQPWDHATFLFSCIRISILKQTDWSDQKVWLNIFISPSLTVWKKPQKPGTCTLIKCLLHFINHPQTLLVCLHCTFLAWTNISSYKGLSSITT